jgi:Na+-driven multidrug efflux pump
MMSIAMFLYDFSYGLNDAAAAIIGKQIGMLNITQAKRIYYVVLITGLILISLITFLVFIFKDYILRRMTNIEEIYYAANKVIYLLVFNTFP